MRSLTKYKKVIIILGIIIIAAVIYTIMIGKKDNRLLVSESPETVSNTELQNNLLALLLEIRSIKLDDSIFLDPAFRSLDDFGQEIVQEPVGRSNPFAPVGFVSESQIIESEIETE